MPLLFSPSTRTRPATPPYTHAMMYWFCCGGRYYAGQRGQGAATPHAYANARRWA